MDGTFAYPSYTDGMFLQSPELEMPLLITLSDCCAKDEQVKAGNSAGYANFDGRSKGIYFAFLRQYDSASGFDRKLPIPDNAADHATQL